MDLVSVEELINILKQSNINFGKGDPYNRLRYYTKIGLIPHMIRKKNSNNTNSGHYPRNIINKIIEIEKLKESGLSNEEIIEKISSNNNIPKLKYFEVLKEKITVNHLFVALIILGTIFELYRINLPKEKQTLIDNTTTSENHAVTESGINFISPSQKKVFVPSKKVKQDSNILISPRGSIFPANQTFVSEVKEGLGFIVETNIEVTSEVKFTWSIIN
jgi:DNA-binding transcriptional MerR regulator